MRSNRVLVGLLLALMVVAVSVAAGAQGFAKTQRVTFDEAIKIQGQLIPAGNYTIDHQMDGQKHIMVFKQTSGGRQEFRFACNMVQLPSKAKQTLKVYDTASGTRVLKSMTFAGDTYEHVLGE